MSRTERLPAPGSPGNYVLVRAGALRLLFAQEDVGAAEYLAETPRATGEQGVLQYTAPTGQPAYAAALSDAMTLLEECPPGRRIATKLRGGEDLAWCWDDLHVLIGARLQFRPLPHALSTRSTPVRDFVVHAGETAFHCTPERLRDFVFEGLQ